MMKLNVLTVMVAACFMGGLTYAQTMTLNLGYSLSPDSHYGAGAQAFAQEIDRLSEGRITIVEQPANALGGEREMIEGLQIGSVDMVITSTGPVGNFVPEVLVLDLPFLFRDYEHARGVLDGPIGQELLERFPERGIVALAWSENGFRHLTNNRRAVRSPEDLQGLKIRTMENQVHIRAFQAAGAAPTPMAFPELFTALQQGTVDGQENPIPVITSANFQEVQRYLSLTGHVYSPALVLISPFVWERLSEEEQGWFKEAARASVEATRDRVTEVEREGIEALRAAGMDVTTDIDIAPFQAAVAPAYEDFTRQYGDELLERIRTYGE
jgi:tripartite ATP-independent transporter DctP family solute receptor